MLIPSEPPAVKAYHNVLNTEFLEQWSQRCFLTIFGATDPANPVAVIMVDTPLWNSLYFSCSWWTMKMASVISLPGKKAELHPVDICHIVDVEI